MANVSDAYFAIVALAFCIETVIDRGVAVCFYWQVVTQQSGDPVLTLISGYALLMRQRKLYTHNFFSGIQPAVCKSVCSGQH
jgi:hypothetical protein